MPVASEIANASSWPTVPWMQPAAREHERAERDQHVADREPAAARACASRANRTADHERAADEHDRADAAADAGEARGQRVEEVLADRDACRSGSCRGSASTA